MEVAMRFGPTLTKWLKCLHLLAAAGWAGGAISLMLLHFLRFRGIGSAGYLHGIDMSSHLIDTYEIVWLGAIGCLLTGLLYSLFTGWGFFRHRWLLVKWVITLFCVLSGTFWLGPWETAMLDVSGRAGDAALSDPGYLYSMHANFWLGVVQVALIVFAMCISVFRPWRGKGKKSVTAPETSPP
jgi:hypothetical protein